MTRLTAKDHLGVEVQVVIARAVVAKNQGTRGKHKSWLLPWRRQESWGTQRCLLLKSPSTRPA